MQGVDIDQPCLGAGMLRGGGNVCGHLFQGWAMEWVEKKGAHGSRRRGEGCGVRLDDPRVCKTMGASRLGEVASADSRQVGRDFHADDLLKAVFKGEKECPAFAAAEVHKGGRPCPGGEAAEELFNKLRVSALIVNGVGVVHAAMEGRGVDAVREVEPYFPQKRGHAVA